jgi:hypothetical protein
MGELFLIRFFRHQKGLSLLSFTLSQNAHAHTTCRLPALQHLHIILHDKVDGTLSTLFSSFLPLEAKEAFFFFASLRACVHTCVHRCLMVLRVGGVELVDMPTLSFF